MLLILEFEKGEEFSEMPMISIPRRKPLPRPHKKEVVRANRFDRRAIRDRREEFRSTRRRQVRPGRRIAHKSPRA